MNEIIKLIVQPAIAIHKSIKIYQDHTLNSLQIWQDNSACGQHLFDVSIKEGTIIVTISSKAFIRGKQARTHRFDLNKPKSIEQTRQLITTIIKEHDENLPERNKYNTSNI